MTQADSVLSTPPTNTSSLPDEKPTLPEGPVGAADALYIPTDISPEEAFQAIGRLRKEARDAIDELIRFLDKTDNYVSRELEDDADAEPDDPGEPSLGSFDGLVDQRKSWLTRSRDDVVIELDAELDDSDDEPSLGSHELREGGAVSYLPSECRGQHDLEETCDDEGHIESGIGDLDGLQEQVGGHFGEVL